MDAILWALCAAFVVWEIYAHFIARNRAAHTLSNRIWQIERRHHWTKGVFGAALVVLFLHLVLHLY